MRMPRAPGLAGAAREPAADEADGICERKFLRGFRTSMAIFEFACRDAAIAHDHTVWNADELGIRELDARPLVTIVEQYVDSRGKQFGVKAFGGFTDSG
jgi:hypothetical protein